MFRSKATSYAILALSEVARRRNDPRGTGVQASEVSEEYDLPTAYAAKVMGQLVKARVLRSGRGPRGGFQLARAPEKISLLEVFEAVHGVVDDGGGKRVPGKIPESLRRDVSAAFANVTDQIRKRMAAVTLAHVLKK